MLHPSRNGLPWWRLVNNDAIVVADYNLDVAITTRLRE
jgi:hypothetical protein